MFSWANYHGYGLLTGVQVEDLNRMTRGHCDKEFVSSTPEKKWVWFYKVPLDPFFIFKVLRYKIKIFIHDYKSGRLWRNHDRKYGKN